MLKIPIDFTGSFIDSGFSKLSRAEAFINLQVSLGKTSEGFLLLIVLAMFLGGIWLLFDEALKSSKKREEDFGAPPSGIAKFVASVSTRFGKRPRMDRPSSEGRNRSSATVRETPEKAA